MLAWEPGGGGADDVECFVFLDEDYYAQVLFFPGGLDFDLLRRDEREGGFGGDGGDLVERAEDGGVADVFASVFTGLDGGFEVGFGDG